MSKKIGIKFFFLSNLLCLSSCGLGTSQEDIDKTMPINVYFYDAFGQILFAKEFSYGDKVVYDAEEYPSKVTSEGTFVFNGWDIDGDGVKDDLPRRITREIHAFPLFDIDEIVGTDGLKFELRADNLSYAVTKGVDVENVIIPRHLNNKFVTEISPNAFKEMKNVKSIALPDSIGKIGYAAFMGCSSLEEIALPDPVKTIDSYAFCGCTSLKKVILSPELRDIYDMAFADCSSLEEIYFNNSNSVRIFPNKLMNIGNYAFFNTGLKTISIPESVVSLGSYAFANSENLEIVTFLEGDEKRNNQNNIDESVDNKHFLKLKYNKMIQNEKTEETSSIEDEDETFGYLTNIPVGAFNACIKLKKVTGLSSYIKTIDSYAFAGTKLENFILPKSVERIGSHAFYNCEFTRDDFTNCVNLKIVDSYAFANSMLSKINLSSAEIIFDHAFENCKKLTSLSLSNENKLEKVYDYAFANCIELSEKLIFNKTSYFGDYSFFNCVKINGCEFNMSKDILKTIGNHAFDYEFKPNVYESISFNFTFKYIKNKEEIADYGINVFLESASTKWSN